jgi:hypothetical protein
MKRARGMSQMVELLLSKCEAKPQYCQKKKNSMDEGTNKYWGTISIYHRSRQSFDVLAIKLTVFNDF